MVSLLALAAAFAITWFIAAPFFALDPGPVYSAEIAGANVINQDNRAGQKTAAGAAAGSGNAVKNNFRSQEKKNR